jgi:DNA-binding NarL/FixJ family response regulator
MITVVVVDDHPIVRAGLTAVLGKAADITVVGGGASGQDALSLVEKLKPNVLVLDLNLPGLDGIEVARRLCRRGDGTRILILTVHREMFSVFELLECGALGYVLKDEALETLANAVRAVARGENWLSPEIATQVVRRAVGGRPAHVADEQSSGEADGLTRRELQVLSLLAQGLDNASIARQLVLATRTIQNHVSNIYAKIGVSSRTEAVLYAIRNGIVQPPLADP